MICPKCGKEMNNIICSYCNFNLENGFVTASRIDQRLDEINRFMKECISNNTVKYTKPLTQIMTFEDVFTITGQGIVVVGKILEGTIHLGDKVDVLFSDDRRVSTVVTRIEMYKKQLQSAMKGDSVGLFLRGVKKEELKGAIYIINAEAKAFTKSFIVSLRCNKKEEGGKGVPIFDYYKPLFQFPTGEERGMIEFNPENDVRDFTKRPTEDVMIVPGASRIVHVNLDHSLVLFPGMDYKITEGNSLVVGSGTIVELK